MGLRPWDEDGAGGQPFSAARLHFVGVNSVEISNWREPFLPALVEHWNRSFRDRPNFFEIASPEFRERVMENGDARFDPDGFFLAIDGDQIVGFSHAVGHQEREGFLAFLHVEESYRGCGIGTALYTRCRDHLADRETFRIDGQCVTPYYGNVQGPFLPWWGSPEGIGILADDSVTIGFLRRRGHEPRYEAVSLEMDLAGPGEEPLAPAEGVVYRLFERSSPMLGASPLESVAFTRGNDFLTWSALAEGICVGAALFYPMERAHPGKWGIYHLEVDPRARGRGVGGGLLGRLLGSLCERGARCCEVLSIPELSAGAVRLYRRAGFREVRRWAIF